MRRIKIFSAAQIKEIDRLTIEKQGIASWQLMERAVDNLLPRIMDHVSVEEKITIMAGVGNNGGDGLALARKLKERGYEVEVLIVPFSRRKSEDFLLNLQRLEVTGVPYANFKGYVPYDTDVVVDAVFGVGLNRPAKGVAAEAIKAVNEGNFRRFSVDMPSGLYADTLNAPDDPVVKADKVFTFQFPKYSFFFSENEAFVPRFEIIDIGLDEDAIAAMPADKYYLIGIDPLPPRRRFAAKWDFGHAVIVGGSLGKSGAVCFSAQAAMRTGAGWTTVHVPEELCVVLQTRCPEIMCVPAEGKEKVRKITLNPSKHTFALGPGLGTAEEAARAMEIFLQQIDKPLVVDADGLNILAANPEIMQHLPANSILTPHSREFARLAGTWASSPEKFRKAKDFAALHQVVLVLKGAYTLITDGTEMIFNSTGNPALAKAGTGDVLTGMITGFLAQKLPPLPAAAGAVYLHGLAADRWVEKYAEQSLTPVDLMDLLPEVI